MPVKITIIGMDSLGQSIGLALKRSEHDLTITAHDRNQERSTDARKRGAADQAEWNLPRAVENADLVIVNEPLHHLEETFELIGGELRPDAVVTDTSNIKKVVLRWAAEQLPETAHFVGSTPMVSPEAPRADLFDGQRYAILPPPEAPEAAVRLVANVITLMGAEPLFIEEEEHDSLMAAVMQLPMLTGAALFQLASGSNAWREMAAMSDSPFARATLLPPGAPADLVSPLLHNRDALVYWLESMQQEIDELIELLQRDDGGEGLEARLAELVEAQARWQRARQGDQAHEHLGESFEETRGRNSLRSLFQFGRGKDKGT